MIVGSAEDEGIVNREKPKTTTEITEESRRIRIFELQDLENTVPYPNMFEIFSVSSVVND